MTDPPKCYGIIPSRYASSRFPGKPLAEIHGMPMFWHVYKRASQCTELEAVALATDDQRIEDAAKKLNVPVIMTRSDHPSGTDRVLEAAIKMDIPDDSVVVNIQGDEPAMQPKMISQLIAPFTNPATCVSTLARRIDYRTAENPDQVKVVLDKNGDAIYFSRSIVPYPREDSTEKFLGHIGIYAFRLNILKQFVSLPVGVVEAVEKLEQLRLIENRIPIHVVETELTSFGVDRPEDIEKVSSIIDKSDLPKKVDIAGK
ncbi:MAG: 3-deoxy-manno-octulosonate cytidylyltransferase [Desulfobacteraceae bacterium]|nr:3-deoxy-manno-octulosonate cytidylyltransferase [Desulfobacteraceae bacterium]MBC2755300.1 3-deoxy-manno-octulosonate cytidylyltransferase [Desulfobacteraceae bacterium]